jgi:hypothetical protein
VTRGRLIVLSVIAAGVGGLLAAGLLIAAAGDDDDGEPSVATATGTPTPEPTPDGAERFGRQFTPVGCQLLDFTTKLNTWTAEAQARADRIEILGGIGFWRQILTGIQQEVDRLPERYDELKQVAVDYVVAVDTYLANLGEYWFTAQQPSGDAALNQLTFADEQAEVLQAAAEEAAGGEFSLECPPPNQDQVPTPSPSPTPTP